MIHTLPELPYALDALEPHISRETLEYHWGKHHRAYVNKLNELISGTEFENKPLEEIVLGASGPIFNNAAQVWNHTFYWNCLVPDGKPMSERFKKALGAGFQSPNEFEKKMKAVASGMFGSGWAWLVLDRQGVLGVVATSNANSPAQQGLMPLLTLDVWEHAYYIDYRNDRAKYLEGIWNVINWQFVERNLDKARSAAAA